MVSDSLAKFQAPHSGSGRKSKFLPLEIQDSLVIKPWIWLTLRRQAIRPTDKETTQRCFWCFSTESDWLIEPTNFHRLA